MRSAFLDALSPEDTRQILAQMRRRRFARGEVIFHEGDPAGALHLIEKGRVAVRASTPSGDLVTLDLLVPGAICGEVGLLSENSLRSATVVALEPVETLSMDGTTFRAMIEGRPQVAMMVINVLSERLVQVIGRLAETIYVPADVRVLRQLLHLADIYDADSIPLTQKDLAELAGTTRGTANRVLRREQSRGHLELRRGRLVVIDRAGLSSAAR